LLTTAAYYVAFVGLGFVVASLGPTLTALADQTGVTLSVISSIFVARSTGYLSGSILGGRLYDRWPGHPVMATVLGTMALAMALMPLATWLPLLALLMFLLGVSEGVTDVGGNALLVWVHRQDIGAYMNGLHLFFGVGAFVSPLIVAQAMGWTGGVAWAYWLLALLIAPIALWVARLPSPAPLIDPLSKANAPIRWSVAVMVAIFLFCVVGSEVIIAGWIHTYASTTLAFTPENAAYLNSAFFGAFTLGRIIVLPIANRIRPRTILLVNLLGSVISTGLVLIWPASSLMLWIGVCGVGLFIAPLFATTLTWAERRITMTGKVTSVFFIGSSTSAIVFPWLVGQLFERNGAHVTIIAELVSLVLALAVFAVMMAYGGPARVEQKPA
jgi:FHS family Na+ dependent glucose MFS transporter 1